MEQDYTSSRKRTSRPCVPPYENLCQCYQCPCHDGEPGPPNPKRKRPQRRLRTPPPPRPVFPLEPASASSHQVFTDSFDTNTQTNSENNPFGNGFSLFPPATPLDLQLYLNYENQQFLQQSSGAGNDIVDVSASCTVTNDTFSPRSLIRESLLDPNEFTNQSPNIGNEFSLEIPDYFGLGLGLDNDELLWNVPSEGLTTFSRPVEFETPFISEPVPGLNSNISSFPKQFPASQPGRGESPFTPATVDKFIRPPNAPPWSVAQAIQETTFRRLEDKIIRQDGISTEVFQPNLLPNSRWKDLQPSKRSSATSSTLEWSNSTPGRQSVQPLPISKIEVKLPPKTGFRNGPLSPRIAAHARQMRKYKACWPCKLLKVKCSFSDPCDRCTIKISPSQPRSSSPSASPPTSLSQHVLCYRGALADFTNWLFPDHVTSRYSKDTINLLIANNVDFTNNKIVVEMWSGLDYPLIKLTATEFRCRNKDFLALDYVIPNKDSSDQCQRFTPSYAPPIGLHESKPEDLRAVCLEHIRCIINQKRDIGEAHQGDISIITLKAFEAVNKFRKSSPESSRAPLLRKAVMLYAMNYFMSRITPLTKKSAEKVIQRLQRPQSLPFEDFSQSPNILTARLLNVQIKHAMQHLLRDMTGKVLTGLEKEMLIIPKPHNTWADHFCIVLILCMCIEAAQVESDSRAMTKIRTDRTCTLSRSQLCQDLDSVPFARLTDILHTAYKTNRAKENHGGTLGFNPIRFGFPNRAVEGITPQMRTLVNDVKEIMVDYRKVVSSKLLEALLISLGSEMVELIKNPSFDDPKPDLLTHHMEFRGKNSGRLVSKFLLSFL